MAATGDDDTDNPELRLRPDELLAFQRELKEEKELLQQMLEKIDSQVHALQVEQLHLLGMVNKSFQESQTKSKKRHEANAPKEESTSKTLDFSVPATLSCFEEEEDEED